MLYCGMSELDITPALGSSMPGYFSDRKSTDIIDRLYAKALVVESEGEVVAFVVLDTILVEAGIVQQIRERVQQMSDIAADHVMVSATHTHTGPPVATTTFLSTDPEYLSWLVKKAADAVIIAYQNRQEARIGYGIGMEDGIAFNRRFFMKDGTVRTNPGVGNPDVVRSVGPIDPQVSIMRIDTLDGQPIGVLTNYALHTDTVGGTKYCADYPGELSKMLKKALGDHVVSMFMMGASGNINHINVMGISREEYVRDPFYYKKLGRILAGEVLKVHEKIATHPSMPIKVEQSLITLQYRQPTSAEVDQARLARVQLTSADVEWNFAGELLKAYELGEGEVQTEIQVIRVGEIAVVGLPGEIFVEYGLEIKKDSPFPFTIINELCNGVPGTYICTREAYEQGGYEPRITSNNRLQIDTGEILVAETKKLLSSLH